MDVFYTDLDHTLIYSYKHDIGKEKRSVEIYNGREVSFITEKTYRLLLEVKKRMCIVPVTTRTMEQYGRIDLGIGKITYALVCNGGVLLKDGQEDPAWYEQLLQLVRESRDEMERAVWLLEQEKSRIFEVRYIKQLFVFTKCRFPQDAVRYLKHALHPSKTDVFSNGEKVYVVPKNLNKGMAAARFQQAVGVKKSAAAGDSAFDVPMLEQADLAMAPAGYGQINTWSGASASVYEMSGKHVFSEELLEFLLDNF